MSESGHWGASECCLFDPCFTLGLFFLREGHFGLLSDATEVAGKFFGPVNALLCPPFAAAGYGFGFLSVDAHGLDVFERYRNVRQAAAQVAFELSLGELAHIFIGNEKVIAGID